MKNTIEFNRAVSDYEDYENGGKIIVQSDVEELISSHEENEVAEGFIYYIGIDNNKNSKAINIGVPINELELFAKSIITHIEIIRATYGEQIKQQHDKGNII